MGNCCFLCKHWKLDNKIYKEKALCKKHNKETEIFDVCSDFEEKINYGKD